MILILHCYLRPKRSAISNLIEIFHHLYTQLDSPNCSNITAFYLVFQRASYKVSHQRFLEKLPKIDNAHYCLNPIKGKLEQRRQTVKVNDHLSSDLPVVSGFLKGSLLGLLFFLVYTKDMLHIIISTNFGSADEFKVIGDNPVTLNIDLRRTYKLCSDNLMSMNLAKSEYVAMKSCSIAPLSI